MVERAKYRHFFPQYSRTIQLPLLVLCKSEEPSNGKYWTTAFWFPVPQNIASLAEGKCSASRVQKSRRDLLGKQQCIFPLLFKKESLAKRQNKENYCKSQYFQHVKPNSSNSWTIWGFYLLNASLALQWFLITPSPTAHQYRLYLPSPALYARCDLQLQKT